MANINHVRVSKQALHFGRQKIYQADTVPAMDEGRSGDIVIIDNSVDQEHEPTATGVWVKIPSSDSQVSNGTVVVGTPGAISKYPTIIIQGITVTFTDTHNIIKITNDINVAHINNIDVSCTGNAIQLVEITGGSITVSENSLGLYSYPALVDNPAANGVWRSMHVPLSSALATRSAQFYVENPDNKTYPILQSAAFPFAIQKIIAVTDQGSINVSIQINGVSVDGLDEVTVTDVQQTTLTSGGNIVEIGDFVSLVTDTSNSAKDLSVMLVYQNTG